MKIKIRGEEWELLFGQHLRGRWGYTDYDARVIKISDAAEGAVELDTVIHEVLHAALQDVDEPDVRRAATDLMRALTRAGFVTHDRETDDG